MSGIIKAQTTCRLDVVINRYFTPNSSGLEERRTVEINQCSGVSGSNPDGSTMGVAIWRITGRTVYTVLVQRHTNTAP